MVCEVGRFRVGSDAVIYKCEVCRFPVGSNATIEIYPDITDQLYCWNPGTTT